MEDVYDTCPFDKSHRILRARMPTHLTKCEKRHTKENKKRCPFDARHIVDEVEWHHHCNTCPGRETVIHHALITEDPVQDLLLPIVSQPVMQCDDWDQDVEVQTYNPAKMIEDKPILRLMVGGSKKERKRFREQERLRRAQLENELERKNKKEQEIGKKDTKPKKPNKLETDFSYTSEPADQEYKPLRRPKNPPTVDSKASAANNLTEVKPVVTKEDTNNTYPSASKNVPLQAVNVPVKQQPVTSSFQKETKLDFASAASKNRSMQKESFTNNSFASEKIESLSKTIENLELDEEEHQKENESLDQKLLLLKQNQEKLNNSWTKVGTKHKKPKNAANFSNNH